MREGATGWAATGRGATEGGGSAPEPEGGASGFDSIRIDDEDADERGWIVPVGVRSTGPEDAVSNGLEKGLEESRVASEHPVRMAAAAVATSRRRPSRTLNKGLFSHITQPIERHFLAAIKRVRG
ncbi:MAG TPA: hypothetical protein PKA55_11045 [Rhodoblastus sp.]|nr:hypothetical protein [Rhodoblastus sp.]